MEFTVKSHNIESTLGQKFYLCFRLPMKCGLFYVRKRKISLYLQCPLQLAPTPPQVIPQVSLPEQPPSQDNASVQVFILSIIVVVIDAGPISFSPCTFLMSRSKSLKFPIMYLLSYNDCPRAESMICNYCNIPFS